MAKGDPMDTTAAKQVLERLRTCGKAGPFLSIAASAAGVNKNTAAGWVHIGRAHLAEGKDSFQAAFTLEVDRIQAEWKLEAMERIAQADRDTRDAAANVRWILERLDRETFDLSKPAKGPEPKIPGAGKKVRDAAEMQEIEKDLERPEVVQ